MAGDDTAMLTQLKRVKTPADLARRVVDLQAKISKGVKPLVVDAESSDEDVAAYREAVDIPDEVTDYRENINFSETVQPTERDTALLESFTQTTHDFNIPAEQAQGMLNWYEETVEAQQQDRAEGAVRARAETADTLRGEWGGEYAGNVNAVKTFLDSQLGEEGATGLVQKQFTDGTFLGDNVHFLRMMAQVATDTLGPNAIFSGDTQQMSTDLNARKDELLKLRGGDKDQQAEYKSDKVQSELTEIYAKLDRLKQREA